MQHFAAVTDFNITITLLIYLYDISSLYICISVYLNIFSISKQDLRE